MRSSIVKVDNIEVPVSEETFTSANVLTVKVGTTGYQGGDTGHGGRTVFILQNEASTDIRCSIDSKPVQEVESIEIILGGDCELETFLDALRFAVATLEQRIASERTRQV